MPYASIGRALLATGLLAAAACSGSSASDTGPKPDTASSPTPSTSSEATTTASTSTSSTPAPGPSETVRIATLRSPPPKERLPAFRAVKIASANYPAGLAAAPDGRIFFSELWGGHIRVIRRDGTLDPKPWANVNAKFRIHWVQFFHGGLSGIAFDPDFRENHFVYVVTQVPDKKTGFARKSLIVRFKEVKGRGTAPRVLLTLPASKFDNTYSLVFGPDGMLYIPTGFLTSRGKHRGTSLRGKILRVLPDGGAPADNPYGARAPLVWARGFKNTFDLAFFPRSDLAIGGDNGTVGHDEVNVIMAGHDYGYPKHEGVTRIRGLTPPMLDYGRASTAPVGIVYYRGRRFPALRGRFLMCENHGNGMLALRIDRSDPGRLRRLTRVVEECTLDVIATPDGSVVFSDAGAIYKLAHP